MRIKKLAASQNLLVFSFLLRSMAEGFFVFFVKIGFIVESCNSNDYEIEVCLNYAK